jgi:anti-sigma B factor antagonist
VPAIPEFHVSVDQRERLRVVEVEGEVDVLTAPQLGAAVDDEDNFDQLIIDLSKVPFMSSVGLGLVSRLHRHLSRQGAGLALVGVQDDVMRLLEVTGLLEAVLVADDVDEAIELLAEQDSDDDEHGMRPWA